jgi:two-component system, NarL family, nitrate/nitrite response regulator NarL
MIRVLICSDVRIYREGLAEVLERRSGITVVGTSSGAWESLAQVRALGVDVVLLDMSTAESVAILRELAGAGRATQVVALGVAETKAEVVAYAEAGVAGYVTREQALDDLVDAIVAVARGEAPCSPKAAAMLLHHVSALADTQHDRPALAARLTEREREILALIRAGLSNKQIGRQLCIELPTVKNHVHNILEKLGVSGRHEAAQLSRELTLS